MEVGPMLLSTALAFQRRGKLTRTDLGVEGVGLKPSSAPEHVEIAVPGFVGPNYQTSGLCLVSVNPAGGKNDYRPTSGDTMVYEAAHRFSEASSECIADRFRDLGQTFVEAMPSWGSQWRHVRGLLEATGVPLDAIAYVYLVPYRTRDDNGSRLPKSVISSANRHGLYDLLDTLNFGVAVTMDGPSRDSVNRWAEKRGRSDDVIYYTRKRDAHSDRALTLQRVQSRWCNIQNAGAAGG